MDLSQPHPELITATDVARFLAKAVEGQPMQDTLRNGTLIVAAARMALPEAELVRFVSQGRARDPERLVPFRVPEVSCDCLRVDGQLFMGARPVRVARVHAYLHNALQSQAVAAIKTFQAQARQSADAPGMHWTTRFSPHDFELSPWREVIDPSDMLDDPGPFRVMFAERIRVQRQAHLQAIALDQSTPRPPGRSSRRL